MKTITIYCERSEVMTSGDDFLMSKFLLSAKFNNFTIHNFPDWKHSEKGKKSGLEC